MQNKIREFILESLEEGSEIHIKDTDKDFSFKDVGLDSLAIVELHLEAEKEFNITVGNDYADTYFTMVSLIERAYGRQQIKTT